LTILALFIFVIFPLIIGFGFYTKSSLIPTHVRLSPDGITFEKRFGKKNKFYRWIEITKIETRDISIGKGRIVRALKIHLVTGKVTFSQYLYPDIANKIQSQYKSKDDSHERRM
jgi:hypothetical protein